MHSFFSKHTQRNSECVTQCNFETANTDRIGSHSEKYKEIAPIADCDSCNQFCGYAHVGGIALNTHCRKLVLAVLFSIFYSTKCLYEYNKTCSFHIFFHWSNRMFLMNNIWKRTSFITIQNFAEKICRKSKMNSFLMNFH